MKKIELYHESDHNYLDLEIEDRSIAISLDKNLFRSTLYINKEYAIKMAKEILAYYEDSRQEENYQHYSPTNAGDLVVGGPGAPGYDAEDRI